MEDRTPTPGQEGRVLITPENGSAPFYAKVTMADNPTNPGTPLNKATLLTDETEEILFGNADDRTVDDALNMISIRISLIMRNAASMALTITDTAGHPIPGVYVNGVFDENGNDVKTNASGQINGYVAEGDSTLSITNYADIAPYSEVFTAGKGHSYTKTIQVTTRNFLKILSSGQYRFSENVSRVDASVGGGGGGGRNGKDTYSGFGGPGGFSVIQENVSFESNVLYQAIVGSGGLDTHYSTPYPGGDSSFLGLIGKGGTSNEANGSGGDSLYNDPRNGLPGTNGQTYIYTSFTEQSLYGGGGGGGAGHRGSEYVGGSGGSPGGGDGGSGGSETDNTGKNGINGLGGGGGGASVASRDEETTAGSGGSGVVAIRMHLLSAS